jgi:hypothetical protein
MPNWQHQLKRSVPSIPVPDLRDGSSTLLLIKCKQGDRPPTTKEARKLPTAGSGRVSLASIPPTHPSHVHTHTYTPTATFLQHPTATYLLHHLLLVLVQPLAFTVPLFCFIFIFTTKPKKEAAAAVSTTLAPSGLQLGPL